MKELQRQASPNIVIALAGNKADLASKRVVEFQVWGMDRMGRGLGRPPWASFRLLGDFRKGRLGRQQGRLYLMSSPDLSLGWKELPLRVSWQEGVRAHRWLKFLLIVSVNLLMRLTEKEILLFT